MRYTQTYTDIFLKEDIKQSLDELIRGFDNNISKMELCMEQLHEGLNLCKKKKLNNILILWNYVGFINMCAMELKIYMKSIVASTNEWEMRTHIKTAYLLIHSFYGAYDKIQNDYRRLKYHQEIGETFSNDLKIVSESVKDFRKLYLRHISIIRHNTIAHLQSDLSYHIATMESFQLSQTIEIIIMFDDILNKIGELLNEEIKFVMSNLDKIK